MHRTRSYRKYNDTPQGLTSSPSIFFSDAAAGRTRRGVVWRSVSPPRIWLGRRLFLRPQHKHKMAGSRRLRAELQYKLKTEAEVALDTTANDVGDLPAAMWMYWRLRLTCGRRTPGVSCGGAVAAVRHRIQSHDLQSEYLPRPRYLDTSSKSPRRSRHHGSADLASSQLLSADAQPRNPRV